MNELIFEEVTDQFGKKTKEDLMRGLVKMKNPKINIKIDGYDTKTEEFFHKNGCGRDLRGLFPLVQGQNNTGVELLFEEESIKHLKTVLPVLPDGTYHNYELFASFRAQRYNVSDKTFDTDYQVLIVEGIKIIGIANYIHTESADLLFDQKIYTELEEVLFNENANFNMADYFTDTALFRLSMRTSHNGQKENYITNAFAIIGQAIAG